MLVRGKCWQPAASQGDVITGRSGEDRSNGHCKTNPITSVTRRVITTRTTIFGRYQQYQKVDGNEWADSSILQCFFVLVWWYSCEGEMSYPRGECPGGNMSRRECPYITVVWLLLNSSRTDIIKPTSFLCLDTALQAWCFNQSRCFKVVFSESFIIMIAT